jgi:hypothetical protein
VLGSVLPGNGGYAFPPPATPATPVTTRPTCLRVTTVGQDR